MYMGFVPENKLIRIRIRNSNYLAHTGLILAKIKLLKLGDLMKFQLGILVHKLASNKLPSNISI